MPRSGALLVAALLMPGAAAPDGQQFTSTTALLVLDVSAVDANGDPVAGLRPEDLIVTLNGKTQPVRTLVFLATHAANTNAAPRPAGADPAASPASATAGDATIGPDPRLFVVMVDDLSMDPGRSKGLLVAAERFVDSIPPRDWVGLATTSGMTAVNPSLDRAPLLATLKRTFGRMNDPRRQSQVYVGLMDALMAERSPNALREVVRSSCGMSMSLLLSKNFGQILAENKCASDIDRQVRHNAAFARQNARHQLDALIAVINAMAAAPGVKQLVVLTDGLAVAPQESAAFVPLARAAAAAGVRLTMLMEEPDDVDMSHPSARALAQDQRQLLQQVQTLAEFSGGQFFRVIGQADRFYHRVLASAASVYRIGVEVPQETPPDGAFIVTVAARRPGVKVFASRYAAPAPPPRRPPLSALRPPS